MLPPPAACCGGIRGGGGPRWPSSCTSTLLPPAPGQPPSATDHSCGRRGRRGWLPPAASENAADAPAPLKRLTSTSGAGGRTDCAGSCSRAGSLGWCHTPCSSAAAASCACMTACWPVPRARSVGRLRAAAHQSIGGGAAAPAAASQSTRRPLAVERGTCKSAPVPTRERATDIPLRSCNTQDSAAPRTALPPRQFCLLRSAASVGCGGAGVSECTPCTHFPELALQLWERVGALDSVAEVRERTPAPPCRAVSHWDGRCRKARPPLDDPIGRLPPTRPGARRGIDELVGPRESQRPRHLSSKEASASA